MSRTTAVRVRAAVALAMVASALALLAATPPAGAVEQELRPAHWSMTVTAEGRYLGAGRAETYGPDNAQLVVQASPFSTPRQLSFGVQTARDYDYWDAVLAPAVDDPDSLAVGSYADAFRAKFGPDDRPGLSIENGSSCDVRGEFDIRDIHYRADGTVDRLWALFEEHCGYGSDGPETISGEIRWGEPEPDLRTVPTAIAWPDHTYVGGRSRSVPVEVRAGLATAVDGVRLAGPAAGQFRLVGDSCTGTTLRASTCRVGVRFAPTRPGPASAQLRVATNRGTRVVPLDARTLLGTTSWDLRSRGDDFVGQGVDHHFAPGNDVVVSYTQAAEGDPSVLSEAVAGGNQTHDWTAQFVAPGGARLREQTYTDAGRAGFATPGLAVFGESRGCNTLHGSFTVHDIAYRPDGNGLRHYDISFTQYCDDDTDPMTGRLRYQARSDVRAPGGVRDLVVRDSGGRVTATWRDPAAADHAGVTVRAYPATGEPAASPTAGRGLYQGSGHRLVAPAPTSRPLTLSFFSYDRAGNVGAPVTVTLVPR